MMKSVLPLLILLLATLHSSATRISGTVTDEKGGLLPFASVIVKGTTQGTTSNEKGNYFLSLAPGDYILVCQYVGFARVEKPIKVGNDPVVVDFSLEKQILSLDEVIVRPGGEDPAYEIMRNAIRKRKDYVAPLDSFTCEAYIKTLIKSRKLPKSFFGQKIEEKDKKEMGLDSTGKGIMHLSESVTNIAFRKPGQIKLEVISGRESGSSGYGFNFPTFINFYNNNVNVLVSQLNPRGYVSPVADGAMNYYRYKYLGSFMEDGREIHDIQVIPKRKYEPLFTGNIRIVEGDWRIHSLNLTLSKESQLELLDTLSIRQIHVPLTSKVWQTKDQVIYFTFNKFGIDAAGDFLNVYSNYNTTPKFSRKYFDKVVMKYDTAVNKRSKTYWDSIRPVSLEKEELKDYSYKDSLFQKQQDSSWQYRNRDSLLKKQGHIKVKQVLWSGFTRQNYNPQAPASYSFSSLLKSTRYNTVEGVVFQASGSYNRYLKKSRSRLEIEPYLRYGLSNGHLNAWTAITYRDQKSGGGWNNSNGSAWKASGGKSVFQYNADNPITPLMNSVYTLFLKENYMKVYEAWFGELNWSRNWDNTLRIAGSIRYEDRWATDNTTDFVLFKDPSKTFTPNFPFEKIGAPFAPHQSLRIRLTATWQPGQTFIQYPKSKMAIGSKYPVLSASYEKGVPDLFGSDSDYDKWQLGIQDDLNLKLRGMLKYRFRIGGFLNRKQVFIQDYQHFNGNQLIFAASYLNSFQLAPYYANSTTASFYAAANVEHHFNGMLTNKIPLFRKLNWHLVAGTNAFFVNSNNNYAEVFGGIENIFKVLRVDVVAAYMNGKSGQVGLRLGLGGLLGGNIRIGQ